MKKMAKEFKEFIMRGNVMDMAIGVIIATAFGKITTSLVNDVFMPLIGWLIGDIDLSKLNIVLREAVMDGDTVVKEAVVMGVGTLLTVIIDFILIALIVFILVKMMNRFKKKEEEPEPEPEPEEPSNEEKLLMEIRDLLKEKNEIHEDK